jgi:hypothetical protein
MLRGGPQEDPQGLVEPARSVEHWPALSKYNGGEVPEVAKGMQNCPEVVFALGVARRSAITAATMLVAAVWEVALRFVCTPTGMRPKTAIKQNAPIPIARVTSTKENEAFLQFQSFMGDKHGPRRP